MYRAVVAACVMLAACVVELRSADTPEDDAGAPVEDDVGHSEAALLGGTWFEDTCSADDRAFLRQVMIVGRTVAQSRGMAACIAKLMRDGNGTTGPYPGIRGCRTDPFADESEVERIEAVQRLVMSTNAVRIECHPEENSTAADDQHHYEHSGAEVMRIRTSPTMLPDLIQMGTSKRATDPERDTALMLRVDRLGERASLVWHEAMHAHGYRHCGERGGYMNDVPVIVQQCMRNVALASAQRCRMREDCPEGARIAVASDYPVTERTRCECVRDAVASPLSTAEQPGTPRLDGDEAGDEFGAALARGDFDGDGFDDLAVGAPGENVDTGRVYVYGGTVLGLYPATLLDGSGLTAITNGDRFGATLFVDDVNRDGRPDLLVSAPGARRGRGATYVYRGTRRGLRPLEVRAQRMDTRKLTRAQWLGGFRTDMGDFDADGEVDIVLGTPAARRGAGGFVEYRWSRARGRQVENGRHRQGD